MSINLGTYIDVGRTITPTQPVLETGPSEGAIIASGINDVNKVVTDRIQKQNASKFTVEATKYLTEKSLYQQQLDQQVSSGNLNDTEAKQKWENYDNQQKARYSSMIPEEYHGKFDELRQVENIKVSQELDKTYQQATDKKFAVDIEQTYQAQLKQPRDIALPAMRQVLADPRIPVDKKSELEYKFTNEYDTNAFVSNINNSEDDNEGLSTISMMLDDPEQSKYLTAEQVTAFRSTIKNKMDANTAIIKAQEAKDKAESERAAELAQKQADTRLKDFTDDIYSLYPVDPKKASVIASENPQAYAELTKQKTEFTSYKKASEEERTLIRNNMQKALESGAMDADTAQKIMSTLDAIDEEASKQEKDDPVGTYNERNPKQKPLDDSPINRVTALEASNKPIIPYTKAELDLKRTQWTSPENKLIILNEFVNNAKGAQNQNKALSDQLSTLVPKSELQQYITYAHMINDSLPSFDEDGNVVGREVMSVTEAMLQGSVSKIPTSKLNKQFNDDKLTDPNETRLLRQLYAYYAVRDKVSLVDKDGKEEFSQESYNKAIKAGLGESMLDDSSWYDPSRKGAAMYYKAVEGEEELRFPIGVSKSEGIEQMSIQVKNFSQLTGISVDDVSTYSLRALGNGIYGYYDLKGRPLVYGYTNKKGEGINKSISGEYNIGVPFTLNIKVPK